MKEKTVRVQFELPQRSFDRLVKLKKEMEASSYAEVVRQALKVYEDKFKKLDGVKRNASGHREDSSKSIS